VFDVGIARDRRLELRQQNSRLITPQQCVEALHGGVEAQRQGASSVRLGEAFEAEFAQERVAGPLRQRPAICVGT
jgi:hypothetical protein